MLLGDGLHTDSQIRLSNELLFLETWDTLAGAYHDKCPCSAYSGSCVTSGLVHSKHMSVMLVNQFTMLNCPLDWECILASNEQHAGTR